MANEFRHKRYFRLIEDSEDSSKITFTSVADAQTKIGFRDVWNTSSPTKTFALADSDTTLIVTYEFDTEAEQDAFKDAVDGLMEDSATPWNEYTGYAQHFKTEWLHKDGSVSSTSYPMN